MTAPNDQICRFCGQGKYVHHHGDDRGDDVFALPSSRLNQFDIKVKVMHCDICGHLELFDDAKAHRWWGD